ncbi:MAG: hypothetical protein NDI81_06010 [Desulfobacula sp.]|nr:hypothetical protein [Desulfobacula sp.]
MEQRIIKTIELENGHALVLSDLSRKISEDAYVVLMKASMEIKIEKELFINDPLPDFKFQDILSVLGDKTVYEYKMERNFILNREKDAVLAHMVDTYIKNLGQYVGKPGFPGKFVLKEYKNRIK